MASERLLKVVRDFSKLAEDSNLSEPQILERTSELMKYLVEKDDWITDELTKSHPEFYQQHLIYGDPLDRFSLVSFVWGPGQKTPVHNHTVWGVIGMLRGSEVEQSFRMTEEGSLVKEGDLVRLDPGDVACVSPTIGDIHEVRNAYDDRDSISIHLYGGNIGRIRRSVYDLTDGQEKEFISGYSNRVTPNLWAK